MPTVKQIFGVVDTYHKDWSELRGRKTQDQRKNSQVFVQGQIPAGGRKNTQVAGQGLSQGGGGKPKVIGQGLLVRQWPGKGIKFLYRVSVLKERKIRSQAVGWKETQVVVQSESSMLGEDLCSNTRS